MGTGALWLGQRSRGALSSPRPTVQGHRRLRPIPALLRELGVGGGGVFPVGSGLLLGQAEGRAGLSPSPEGRVGG